MGEEQWEEQRKAALDVALAAARRVALPPPCANEPLAAYVTRAIVEDAALLRLKACSRAFPPQLFYGGTQFFRRHSETEPSVPAFPVAVWPRFSPARFSPTAVTAGHDGLDLVRLDLSERTAKRLDWIWEKGPGDMFDVRMAREPRHDLGDKVPPRDRPPPRDPFLVEREAEALAVWRAAARRRDLLTALLCEGVRSGTMTLTGFLTNDVNRRSIKIQPGWWSDPLLACMWRQGELCPLDGAPSGTPHFRAMQLSPGARQKSAANRPAKPSPDEIKLAYQVAWPKGEPSPTKRVGGKWAVDNGYSVRVVRRLVSDHHRATKQDESGTVTGATVGANGPLRAHTKKT